MADQANLQTLAVDYSACIREQSEIGHTVIHNICNGDVSTVPWGAVSWLGFWSMGALAFALCRAAFFDRF